MTYIPSGFAFKLAERVLPQELAETRRKAAAARKESEAAASRTEQAFCEASPWLNEDRSGNVSCADPGR